ncbi:MAG: SGNH/GDSL hydrolase family protein [Chromatiales bacterium]|nr:MAG: SGNH/GDSL hydrolase family protein [Chromatiales bacterium]
MGYLLTAPLLAPLLLVQGWLVRRRVPQLPEAPGARTGTCGSGDDLHVLIVGDSAAAGVGAPHQEAALAGQIAQRLSPDYRVQWELAAVTGATTLSSLRDLGQRTPQDFDAAVVALGVNDVTSGVSEARWRARQAELRGLLRSRFRVAHVLVCGVAPVSRFPALPQPLRWFLGSRATCFSQVLERDVTTEADCTFLRLDFSQDTALMAPDGFHPGPGIYAEWGRRAAAAIHSMRVASTERRTGETVK